MTNTALEPIASSSGKNELKLKCWTRILCWDLSICFEPEYGTPAIIHLPKYQNGVSDLDPEKNEVKCGVPIDHISGILETFLVFCCWFFKTLFSYNFDCRRQHTRVAGCCRWLHQRQSRDLWRHWRPEMSIHRDPTPSAEHHRRFLADGLATEGRGYSDAPAGKHLLASQH